MDPTQTEMPRKTCFLIGHPTGHSLSPTIHQAAYGALDMNWHYALMDVLEPDLDAVLAGIDGERIVGANVTIPHKQAVYERVDELSDTARAVGAVNTVYRHDGRLVGDNTDVAGFLGPLRAMGRDWSMARAVVLGAGGAARAVAHGLTRELGLAEVVVTARREAAARAIPDICAAPWEERVGVCAEADLIVNTTPVGMAPMEAASPLPDDFAFDAKQTVYDLIYAPETTRLMAAAQAAGASVIGGLPMLIGQAAAAFRIWTGRDMPLEAVNSALRKRMATGGSS